MVSGPITSWQVDEETVDTVSDFTFLGSKTNADDDCSHEIKRCLFLGRKVMTNLDSILKCRDITLSINVYLVKAMVFPLVMYGCESWTIKKARKWIKKQRHYFANKGLSSQRCGFPIVMDGCELNHKAELLKN